VSKHDFDAGIGIVRYVHSLIGLAGNTITKKDVNTQYEGFFSSDNKLTTEGSDLIKLRHDVLQLMTVLYHKYLSIHLINENGFPNIDPFKDDGSKSSEVLSSRSADNEDDSSWDPEMVNATILTTTHLKMTMSAMEKVKMKVNVSPFIDLLM
jgi:hypothetical protein